MVCMAESSDHRVEHHAKDSGERIVLNTSTSWKDLFISDSRPRASRAAAVSSGSSMRRTASSTASLQHRDAIVAVLNSAKLKEAPHDSRAAIADAFKETVGGGGRSAFPRSYRILISAVSIPVAAA